MATTPSYGWVTPSPTDFVTDLPADFETFADAVDASFTADEGDLLVGGTSNIFEPLAIGAAGAVLTSDGDTAEWVIPPAPSAVPLGYDLIGSSTSTSVSSVTFNFSGYDNLLLNVITSCTAGNMALRVELNGVTTNTYRNAGGAFDSAPAAAKTTTNNLAAAMDIQPRTATTGDVVSIAHFTGCNKAAFPVCTYQSIGTFSTTRIIMFGSCISENNTAVTSLKLDNINATNFGTGTQIYLYGAK